MSASSMETCRKSIANLQKVDNGLLTSKISGRASSSACTSSAICTKHSFYQPCCTAQRTWTLSKLMQRKLESFHCGCLRRILRVSYLEKATNEEIMSRSRMPQLSTMIMLKRIKWYGHIQRMEPGRLARSAFDWDAPDQYVHARRAPGGQRKTWMSQIEGDCVRNKVSFTRLQEKAATGSKNAFNNFVVQHFTE